MTRKWEKAEEEISIKYTREILLACFFDKKSLHFLYAGVTFSFFFVIIILISHIAGEEEELGGVRDQCRNGAFNYRDWIEINTLK